MVLDCDILPQNQPNGLQQQTDRDRPHGFGVCFRSLQNGERTKIERPKRSEVCGVFGLVGELLFHGSSL